MAVPGYDGAITFRSSSTISGRHRVHAYPGTRVPGRFLHEACGRGLDFEDCVWIKLGSERPAAVTVASGACLEPEPEVADLDSRPPGNRGTRGTRVPGYPGTRALPNGELNLFAYCGNQPGPGSFSSLVISGKVEAPRLFSQFAEPAVGY
eukprot:3644818-Rhodomonas_salina.1